MWTVQCVRLTFLPLPGTLDYMNRIAHDAVVSLLSTIIGTCRRLEVTRALLSTADCLRVSAVFALCGGTEHFDSNTEDRHLQY